MKILISQKAPSNLSAYNALEEKYGVGLEFRPFFVIEPLSAKEFRAQRINLPDYTAIVFSSRHAIDAYFQRKIFFGDGTAQSIVAQIGPKHRGEKFLITTSDESKTTNLTSLFEKAGLDFSVSVMVKSVAQDLTDVKLSEYGALVLYNPYDLESLRKSFPEFKPNGTAIIAYGRSIAAALEKEGMAIAVKGGPNTEIPSAAKAIEVFLSSK